MFVFYYYSELVRESVAMHPSVGFVASVLFGAPVPLVQMPPPMQYPGMMHPNLPQNMGHPMFMNGPPNVNIPAIYLQPPASAEALNK